MSKVEAVRRALRAGGVPELVRRTRLWLAGQVHPGDLPAPRKAATKAPGRPRTKAPARPRATDVDHARALAWFESRRDVYERLADVAAPYVEPTGTFLDVGANIGFFTRVLAERVGFTGTAHLFEPIPNLAALCAQTLADAPYRAVVHPFGLSDADAELDIYVGGDGNLGWNTIVAERANDAMQAERIAVRRFSDLDLGAPPGFVKVDVEGAEHRVLAGMLDAFDRWERQPVILCEIGWGRTHPHWDEELAVFDRLRALGYRMTTLDGEAVDLGTLDHTTDVLLLPAA
jgi:FkbM family methyltransferase